MWDPFGSRQDKPSAKFVESFLSGLSTNQLLAGIAILIALAREHMFESVHSYDHDSYFRLAYYMMFANALSGYGCTFALSVQARKLHASTLRAVVRVLLFGAFMVTLCIVFCISYAHGHSRQALGGAIGVPIASIFYIGAWVLMVKKDSKLVLLCVTLGYIVTTVLCIAKTLHLRFTFSGADLGCNVDTSAENHLDFGQIVAAVLTTQIVFSFIDAGIGKSPDQIKGPGSSNLILLC